MVKKGERGEGVRGFRRELDVSPRTEGRHGMSRTQKGSKAPGYEYWGKRPGGIMPPGKISKKITHKAERRQARKETEHVPND